MIDDNNFWGESELTKNEIAEKQKQINDQLRRFADAVPKAEGQSVNTLYGFPEDYTPQPPAIETTYVERRVPEHLENEAHKLIDDWLRIKGYDPEEI